MFALCTRSSDVIQTEHLEILGGKWRSMEKWLSALKCSNISETQQDMTKITTGDQKDQRALD